MVWWLLVAVWVAATTAVPLPHEHESEQTRKLLGESVVTSVSVVMDHGNGTKTYLTDGQTQDKRPQVVGTPGTLLAPDRYEFYSFGDDGELVKKLMSLEEIQSLIAGGSEAEELEPLPIYYPQPLVDSSTHTEGVSKVLETVQNLLKGELQAAKLQQRVPPPVPSLPDHSWSILLPGLINSDLDIKEPIMPVRNDVTPLSSMSNDIQSTRPPTTTSQKRPVTTPTKYSSSTRPSTQATTPQKVTVPSTTPTPEYTTAKKPISSSQYTGNHITPTPYTKTTGHLVTKLQNQRPLTTSKKPFVSTKKPYDSDSPFSKIPLLMVTKEDVTTKATTTVKRPVTSEERNPTTKIPDSKKPLPEKQKPSGIPSITHYLPITSSSPSNATTKHTTPSHQGTSSMNLKATTPTKEPTRATTTKRPTSKPSSSQTSAQKVTQTTTKKPIKITQSKPSNGTTFTNSDSNKTLSTKSTQKLPKPTTALPLLSTKIQTKVSTLSYITTPSTTTKNRPEMNTGVTRPNVGSPSTTYQPVNTTNKPTTSYNSQKISQTKKPDTVKPMSNLVGQSSNIVNSKVKPSTVTQQTTATRPLTTNQQTSPTTLATTKTTQPPTRITTFSYTSNGTFTGDLVTSTVPTTTAQLKLTTGITTNTPVSSTIKNVNATESTSTEKPVQKVTQAQVETFSTYQTTKRQPSVPSFQKPTTYHPQNFHATSNFPASSKIPEVQNYSTTTSSFPTKTSQSYQQIKLQSSSPTTDKTSVSYSSSKFPSQASTYPGLITTLLMTKPTTEITPDVSTIGTTTFGLNLDTMHTEPNTFSTDDMPLQEIPLKLYESLKDNVSGPQDIMTTIISDRMPTTTGKIESTYTTINAEDTTLGSTQPTGDKMTTLIESVGSSSTTTPQTEKNIITKKPSTQNSDSKIKEQSNEHINKIAEKDKLQGSASMSVEQRYNITKTSNSSTKPEAINASTTDSSNLLETNNPESTTNVDSTTIYKDQILQDGISAVTSILLDEAQRPQAMKEAMLVSAMKEDQIKDRFKTTTENDLTSTTVLDDTEMQTVRQSNEKYVMKSEVRLNEEVELPEKVTTEKIETTTIKEKPTTTKSPPVQNMNNNNNAKLPLKKNDPKTPPVLPTKESKLNPDPEQNLEMNKNTLEHTGGQTEPPVRIRTTAQPDIPSTTEKIKLADYQEKSVPKPANQFAKKPIPAYQPLESLQPPAAIELHPAPYESMGLEASIAFLSEDVRRFADLCNELAFRMWTSITGKGQIASRSLIMSPFAVTSLLAMVFLGARGPTSGQMNDVLRLDDMVTFNPHQVLQNVTDSVINSKNYGVATAAFVRELYSDKGKGKILDFYKERVQQYYQGHVEEVTFSMIGDIIRRRTNLLVKRQTLGKVPEYLRGSSLNMRPPLAAFSANIFQTDCEQGSTDGRDGEMYFVVRPSTRQRRLVPVPAVVWRHGFLAGYEPSLDATSVSLGADSIVSTILILPGQQGQVAPGDGLARLEQRLIETSYRRGGWSRLLRSLMPRPGLELQIPRFSHRSVLNITNSLQRMGLRDLFNSRADLRGLNGLSNDLHLSDMLQVNTFSTCGEETIGARHHVETYPASPQRMGRDESDYNPQNGFENVQNEFPLSLRPRQARLPDNPRLRFDRPFLYMVRHNPSGMILHMGRFNPRLLP